MAASIAARIAGLDWEGIGAALDEAWRRSARC